MWTFFNLDIFPLFDQAMSIRDKMVSIPSETWSLVATVGIALFTSILLLRYLAEPLLRGNFYLLL